MEEVYIGTKVIAAEPMSEKEFTGLQSSRLGPDVVWPQKKPNRLGYKVRYEDGYVSWSPKETFERAYRKVTLAEASMIISWGQSPKELHD